MDIIKKIKKFRYKIKKNYSKGTWMQISSVDVAEILANSNFDWITLDLEHGAFNDETISNIISIINYSDKIALVRVLDDDIYKAKRYLDLGAAGIILPNMKSQKQIEKFYRGISFPPKGTRGIGFSKSNIFGGRFCKEFIFEFDPIFIGMIEDKEGIKNLNNISKCEFLDGILIGPYDLSASLGKISNFNCKDFKSSLNTIYKVCKINKKPFGIHIMKNFKTEIKKLIKSGGSILPIGTDAVFLTKGQDFN